jgi:hypothetical protein
MPRCSEIHEFEEEDSSSEESGAEELSECNGLQARRLDHDIWVEENIDDLLALYNDVIERGRAMFGDAFWQHGNWVDFADLCYKKTQPFNFPNKE